MDPAQPLIKQDRNNCPRRLSLVANLGTANRAGKEEGVAERRDGSSQGCWAKAGHPGTGLDTDRVTSAHLCSQGMLMSPVGLISASL